MADLMQFELDMPARVIAGPGGLRHVGQAVERLGVSRVLLVCDPYFEACEHVETITEALGAVGATMTCYAGVTGEPDTVMVEKGLERFRSDRCDGMIALGGGSVIDTAKTIAVMATNAGTVLTFLDDDVVSCPPAPLIAAPTTAGTGSEATKVVVIADAETQTKLTGRSRHYMPAVAVLDPDLTASMPPQLIAATGVDALTHAIEALVSRRANAFTDQIALSAAERIWSAIRAAFADPGDERARWDMLLGSFEAGIAFSNASVALVHSMSEPLGACFHVPHGLSNAMLLPAVCAFSVAAAPRPYARLARRLRLGGPRDADNRCARKLIDELARLNIDLGIRCPAAFGIDPDAYETRIDKMTEDTLAAGSTANNPAIPTAEQVRRIYRDVYRT